MLINCIVKMNDVLILLDDNHQFWVWKKSIFA